MEIKILSSEKYLGYWRIYKAVFTLSKSKIVQYTKMDNQVSRVVYNFSDINFYHKISK